MKIVYAICTAVIAIPIALVHWPSSARAQVDAERLGKIPVQMQQYVDDGKISGAVMLLARHGEVVLLEAVGLRDLDSSERMRTDTIFQIQSMTKPITAVATMTLIEDGLLRLDDPVEKYLSEFQGQSLVPNSDEDLGRQTQQLERPITIRDGLTPAIADTSEKADNGRGGVSCQKEENTRRSSNVKQLPWRINQA